MDEVNILSFYMKYILDSHIYSVLSNKCMDWNGAWYQMLGRAIPISPCSDLRYAHVTLLAWAELG